MRFRIIGCAALCAAAACLLAGCPQTSTTNSTNNTNTGSTSDTNENSNTNTNGTGNSNGNSSGTAVVDAILPTGLSIDIDELPEDSDSDALSASQTRAIYDATVRSASTIMFRFHRMADRAMALAARIRNDMTDPTQTQVTGEFTIAGVKTPYKADFAAFDIDDDGTADGSGNAVDLPVAVRIWIDPGTGYEPFLCAVVAVRPSSDNAGRGECYFRPHLVASDLAAADVHAFVQYDRTDPKHVWNRAFISGAMHPRYTVEAGVAQVNVRTSEAGVVEKTIRTSQDFAQNPYNFETFQSAVHYAVGQSALLISVTSVKDGAQLDFADECVQLADRSPTALTDCSAFDTQDMSLLSIPVAGQSVFPPDFPDAPTF